MSVQVIRFAPGLKPVLKHAQHDQKTHGSWATGQAGGNGLTPREIYNLQVGRTDYSVRDIYSAEEKFQSQSQRTLLKPFPPSRELQDKESYNKAYKEYSKEFKEWAVETSRNIQSKTGEKNLDGTVKGVQNYVKEIARADWFVEAFGDGGQLGLPKVTLSEASRQAGRYSFGFRNGEPTTSLSINQYLSRAEPTILHEIAHYATTISATKGFDGHGVEFARNYIYIASKVIGTEYAKGLEMAYRREGIDLGD